MARFDTPIPINLIPEANRCLPLFVPDDPAYIVMLVEHLRKLTNARMYVQDDPASVAIVQDQWRDRMYAPLMDNVVNGNTCSDEDEGENIGYCYRMDTTTDAIQFFYNDPFSDIDEERPKLGQWERYQDSKDKAPDWLNSILEIAGNIATLDANAGYYPNDVFLIPPDSVNPIDDFIDFASGLINLELPYMRIDLQGTGRFEIELLSIPLGGSAVVRWDTNTPIADIIDALFSQDLTAITNTKFVELQRDFTQIPPETQESVSIAINFETGGDHFVEVFIVPKFDYTAITFLGMGGGVRGVTACGELSIISGSGAVINSRNYGLETHRRNGVIMSTVADICEGVLCALETVSSRILLADGDNVKNSIGIGVTGDKTINNDGAGGGVIGLNTEGKQYRNGQAIALLVGLKKWLLDLQTYHDNNTGDIATATAYMRGKYDLYDDFDTKYQNYYNYRLVPNGQLPPFLDIIESLLYCGSLSLADVKTWIIDSYTGDKVLLLSLVENISPIQWTIWSLNNVKPIDDYLSYPCTLRAPYELRLTSAKWLDGSAFSNDIPDWTINATERYARIEIDGTIGIDSLNYHDGVYVWIDGIPTYLPIGIGGLSNYSGSFVSWGSKSLDPFDTAPRSFTVQVPITGAFTSWYLAQIKRLIALPSWSDGSETGSFTVIVTDLGAIG